VIFTVPPSRRSRPCAYLAGADLRWLDWERWSHRQNTAMKLGGLVGTLTLEGDVAPFAANLEVRCRSIASRRPDSGGVSSGAAAVHAAVLE
jgi:hypothetical protein